MKQLTEGEAQDNMTLESIFIVNPADFHAGYIDPLRPYDNIVVHHPIEIIFPRKKA